MSWVKWFEPGKGWMWLCVDDATREIVKREPLDHLDDEHREKFEPDSVILESEGKDTFH